MCATSEPSASQQQPLTLWFGTRLCRHVLQITQEDVAPCSQVSPVKFYPLSETRSHFIHREEETAHEEQMKQMKLMYKTYETMSHNASAWTHGTETGHVVGYELTEPGPLPQQAGV